jgi:hypothetical protein
MRDVQILWDLTEMKVTNDHSGKLLTSRCTQRARVRYPLARSRYGPAALGLGP